MRYHTTAALLVQAIVCCSRFDVLYGNEKRSAKPCLKKHYQAQVCEFIPSLILLLYEVHGTTCVCHQLIPSRYSSLKTLVGLLH